MLGTETRGRPYYVADIPFDYDKRVKLMTEFYKVTAKFKYRDIVALSRCLNKHISTIEKWKYGESFPKTDGIAIDVIEWAKRGKPMNLVYQKDRPSTNML